MNSNSNTTNAAVTPASSSASASASSKTKHDAGIVLPTGAIMSASEFNGEIDRMFDFKRKFQDAWSKGKSVLHDEWEKVESALSSFHEDDDNVDDDKDTDAPPEEPMFKRIKLDESAVVTATPSPTSASTSPLTVGSENDGPKPAPPLPAPPAPKSITPLAPTTVVPEQPAQELTGVPFELVTICATMCDQIYYATSLNNFQLTHPDDPTITAEPVLFDDHGALRDVVPPMAVAIKDTTLIVAWRGSATIMDWVSDAGYAPATSSRWNKVASSNVQAHSAYTSFVESDLAIHETYFLQLIQERNIDTILLTGHSLAGGMANVAHLVLEGQLQTVGSLWHPLQHKLTVRSVAFAAPMTTLVNSSAESPVDDTTRAFLAKIASNSCNLVYGPDIVPHGAGDITYSIDVANALVPEALKVVPYNWVMRLFGIQRKVDDALGNLLSKDGVRSLAKVMVQYQHVSTVVYYPAPHITDPTKASATSSPVPLRDCQFLPETIAEFRGNDLVRVPTVEKVVGGKNSNDTVAVSKQLKVAHSFLMEAFAYNKADPVEAKA